MRKNARRLFPRSVRAICAMDLLTFSLSDLHISAQKRDENYIIITDSYQNFSQLYQLRMCIRARKVSMRIASLIR